MNRKPAHFIKDFLGPFFQLALHIGFHTPALCRGAEVAGTPGIAGSTLKTPENPAEKRDEELEGNGPEGYLAAFDELTVEQEF